MRCDRGPQTHGVHWQARRDERGARSDALVERDSGGCGRWREQQELSDRRGTRRRPSTAELGGNLLRCGDGPSDAHGPAAAGAHGDVDAEDAGEERHPRQARRGSIAELSVQPDNVLLGADGRVCVTDFGLALRTGEAQPSVEVDAASSSSSSDRLTETGMVMGTPAYMPIEQHLGLLTDVRSDQFSFCVALYEALYGVRPFEGESGAELVLSIERGELREARCADVPRDVHAAIVRGLSPRARDRFGSMLELRDALRPRAPRFGVRWGAGLVAVLVGAATMAVAAGVVERDDVAQAEQGIGLALQGVAVQEAVVVTRARTAADCEAAFGKDLGARMLCLDQAVRVRRVATTG